MVSMQMMLGSNTITPDLRHSLESTLPMRYTGPQELWSEVAMRW